MKHAQQHHRLMLLLALVVVGVFSVSPVFAEEIASPGDLAARFAADLASGKVADIRELLAPDVLIYESGGVESSLDEYASHHLPADIKFMSGMQREVISQNTFDFGDAAVVSTLARLSGVYNCKPVDSKSTETLVMRRVSGDWKIVHIHWSSR